MTSLSKEYPTGYEDDPATEDTGTTDEFGVEDSGEYPITPTLDTNDHVLENGEKFVDYSTRGPADVVLSGPITGGWGPGRWFSNRRMAHRWAVEKYGLSRVVPVRGQTGRWAFLVKNLRAV